MPAGPAVLVAVLALVLGLGVACSAEPSQPPTSTSGAGAGATGATSSGAGPEEVLVSPAPPPETDPLCEPAPGRTVEDLPDATIPPVHVSAVPDPAGGADLVAAYTLPAQVAEAGCVVRYDAPGGCVGAVDISAATIPSLVIPEVSVDRRSYPAVEVPGASRPAVHSDEVCQVEEEGGLATVTRAGVVREGFSRNGAARPGDDLVPTLRLNPVSLPDVDVEPVRLERRELDGGVGVVDGDDRTSYVAPAEVLFDTDSAELRPGAGAALAEIAAQIARRAPQARLLVEGHTDDRGDETYGLRLSERRAATVAAWLEDNAGIAADRITTRGYGETRPAYPNDSDAHRQANRRVVITTLG